MFKIETVGDCYVAVTGLPRPQEAHATIMCRFADACNRRLADLLPSLVDKLGEDTAEISMRTGIHVSHSIGV